MAWPYPHLIYSSDMPSVTPAPGFVPAHAVGDLLLYFVNNETVAFGNISTVVDDLAESWTAILQNIVLHDFRERHEVWYKVATGGESTITVTGGAQVNSIVTVVKALPMLSAYSNYLDQALSITSNPTEWSQFNPTDVVAFNGAPSVELIFLPTLNFEGAATVSTYTGTGGLVGWNEGDSLDNGMVIWANRIGGSSSPGATYSTGVAGRYFEGAIALYAFVPFSSWQVGKLAVG